jgi:hypothetical protein
LILEVFMEEWRCFGRSVTQNYLADYHRKNQNHIMKTTSIKSKAVFFTLAILTGIIAGCVSKGYDQGAATSTALQSSAGKVTGLSLRVNDTLAALNQLTYNPQGDLRDQFGKFSDAVKNLRVASTNLAVQVADMQTKAQAYFINWSNQLGTIQSADIRSRSAERKSEVTAKLASVGTSYQGVKNSVAAFTSDVTDIQTYLNTDLTAAGLDKIRDIVAKTKVDAVPVRDSIKKLQSDFSDLGAALSPIMPASKSQ